MKILLSFNGVILISNENLDNLSFADTDSKKRILCICLTACLHVCLSVYEPAYLMGEG